MDRTAVFIGVILAAIPLVFWSAFVLMTLWGWFVVPLGVQALNLPHAIGLALIVGWAKGIRHNKTDDDAALKNIGMWLIGTVIALAVGYFAKQYL